MNNVTTNHHEAQPTIIQLSLVVTGNSVLLHQLPKQIDNAGIGKVKGHQGNDPRTDVAPFTRC